MNPPLSGAYIGTVGHKLRAGSTIDGDTSLSSSWKSHDHVRYLAERVDHGESGECHSGMRECDLGRGSG